MAGIALLFELTHEFHRTCPWRSSRQATLRSFRSRSVKGFFETVTDGETGILVTPNDPAALAGAMRRLFGDPEVARHMGLAGFDRNRTVFDWDEVGRRLRSIAPGLGIAA